MKSNQKIPLFFYLSMLTNLSIENIPNIFYDIDLIIPIPSTMNKIKERRFHHTYEISKIISKKINVKVFKSVEFKKNITENKNLNNLKRFENRKESFIIKNSKELKGKSILIVDDVVTTGSTIINLTKSLLKKS